MVSAFAPNSSATSSIAILRGSNQRTTTDSALYQLVTHFFTRLPWGVSASIGSYFAFIILGRSHSGLDRLTPGLAYLNRLSQITRLNWRRAFLFRRKALTMHKKAGKD
jgi:hypothetical protein